MSAANHSLQADGPDGPRPELKRWAPMETVVRIERHSAKFDIHSQFPGASEFHLGEGEAVYLAELNGMFYVVVDSRAVIELLSDEEKEELADASVSVYEFPSEQGRAKYLASRNINGNVK